MFNEQRKRQFLAEREDKAVVSNNIYDTFRLATDFEEKYNRDLCEWNSSEIIEFYKYYSTPRVQTLILVHSYLTMYTNWCISNGMVSDNQNHYSEINSEMLCKCINMNALRESVFSKDKLFEALKEIPNYCDRYLILGSFEGIPIKNDCMYSAKVSDIHDGNILRLVDGNDIKISKELMQVMITAAEEDSRLSLTSVPKTFMYEYTDGDHIIRDIQRRSARVNHTVTIGTRLRKCGDYLGMPSLTFKALAESGRMWFISEIAKSKSVSVEDAVIKYRKEHEDRYGKMQNTVTYLNTYGLLIREMYGCD